MVGQILQQAVIWNWSYFWVGSFACFTKIFLEYNSEFHKIKKIEWSSTRASLNIFSIIIAGIFTNILTPISLIHAFLYGALWDFIFIKAMDKFKSSYNNKGDDNNVQ